MTTSTPHRHIKKRLMKAIGAHTLCSCGYILFQNRRHEMKHFKRKHVLAIMVTGILIAVAAYYCNYYWERSEPFEFVCGIPGGEGCRPQGIDYVRDQEQMLHFLTEEGERGVDESASILKYVDTLNYERYDYILSYMRKIESLNYSPYLSDLHDCAPSLPQTPIVPTYYGQQYDSIYIYRVQANDKFRHPAP